MKRPFPHRGTVLHKTTIAFGAIGCVRSRPLEGDGEIAALIKDRGGGRGYKDDRYSEDPTIDAILLRQPENTRFPSTYLIPRSRCGAAALDSARLEGLIWGGRKEAAFESGRG